MKHLLLLVTLLIAIGFVNGQTKQKTKPKVATKKNEPVQETENDNSPKKYLTTTTYFDEKNPSKGYVSQTVNFSYSENFVTVTISGTTEKYKVTNTKINEWGTTVYYAIDNEGLACVWKFGKSNSGRPFAQFENSYSKITYNDDFK